MAYKPALFFRKKKKIKTGFFFFWSLLKFLKAFVEVNYRIEKKKLINQHMYSTVPKIIPIKWIHPLKKKTEINQNLLFSSLFLT